MWLMTKYGFYSIVQKLPMVMDKDGKQEKVFDALEWLAAMGSHVPNKAEQMVRYYGYYSNVSRGKRGKLNLDEAIPCILMSEEGAKKYRKNWARLLLPTRNLQFLKMVPTIDL